MLRPGSCIQLRRHLGDQRAAVRRRRAALHRPRDILVNNTARYLGGAGLQDAGDDDILPLLLRSAAPDIVALVSACDDPGHDRSPAHEAFYAAKSAQAGFLRIFSKRLRPKGVRVSREEGRSARQQKCLSRRSDLLHM